MKIKDFVKEEDNKKLIKHFIELYEKDNDLNNVIIELCNKNKMNSVDVLYKLIDIFGKVLLCDNRFDVIGKHNTSNLDFDEEELKMGLVVEMEHTSNKRIAEAITKDHLSECSNYYTRLAKMEKECETYKGEDD